MKSKKPSRPATLALLQRKMADWERMYGAMMSPSEVRTWMSTFGYRDEKVVAEAIEYMESILTRRPVPGNLTTAIEHVLDDRSAKVRNPEGPHIGEMPPAERQKLLSELKETMAKVDIRAKGYRVMTQQEVEARRNKLKRDLAEHQQRQAAQKAAARGGKPK